MQSTVPGFKHCSRCNSVKPTADFFPRVERPGQFLSGCKACRSQRNAELYRNDREAVNSRARKWNKDHTGAWRSRPSASRERTRAYRWNHRAVSDGSTVSAEQISQRFRAFGDKCWMCGSDQDLTVDHVKPRSKGGAHLASNIRPACGSCNSRKGNQWCGVQLLSELKRTRP